MVETKSTRYSIEYYSLNGSSELIDIALSQRLKIRHKGKGKDLVFKLPFFNLCKYHNGLIPFIQRAVSLDDGRAHDSAAEVLCLFKVECFYKH